MTTNHVISNGRRMLLASCTRLECRYEAVERQLGNPEKHEALIATLDILKEHAVARFGLQAENRAARIAEAAAESGRWWSLRKPRVYHRPRPRPHPYPAYAPVDPVLPELPPAPEGPQIEPAFEVKPAKEPHVAKVN